MERPSGGVSRNQDVLKSADYTLNALIKVIDLNERNRAELERIGFEAEEFLFEAESYAGNHLMKTVVFNEFLDRYKIKGIFQGIRWDEHPARFGDPYFEHKEGSDLSPDTRGFDPFSILRRRTYGIPMPLFKFPIVFFMRGAIDL